MNKLRLVSNFKLFVFLISLSYSYAGAENEVFIVSDDDAVADIEGLTSVNYYQDIINNITPYDSNIN